MGRAANSTFRSPSTNTSVDRVGDRGNARAAVNDIGEGVRWIMLPPARRNHHSPRGLRNLLNAKCTIAAGAWSGIAKTALTLSRTKVAVLARCGVRSTPRQPAHPLVDAARGVIIRHQRADPRDQFLAILDSVGPRVRSCGSRGWWLRACSIRAAGLVKLIWFGAKPE
jgi:hypothetical protein